MFGLCDLISFLLCLVFFILGYVLRLKLDKKVFTIQERYKKDDDIPIARPPKPKPPIK